MSAVTILIPTLDEASSIAAVLQSIPPEHAADVLVVDGGSRDATVAIARSLGARVVLQEGRGLGDAIRTGVRRSHGAIIVTMDADGAHHGTHVGLLLARLADGFDVAVASRYSRAPESIGMFSPRRRSTERGGAVRGLGNRVCTWLCRRLFAVPLRDVLNGCKAIRREVFDALDLQWPGQQYDIEIVIKAQQAGFRLVDVPIDQLARGGGASKLHVVRDGLLMLAVIARQWWTERTARVAEPQTSRRQPRVSP